MDIEKTIDGVGYTLRRLPVMKALALEAKLVKMAGSGISAGLDGELEQAFGNILAHIDSEKTPMLIKGTVQDCVVFIQGFGQIETDSKFDEYYSQRLPELHSAFFASLDVNFGGVVESIKKKLTSKGIVMGDSSKQSLAN